MQTIRSVIYIACIVGLISSAVGSAAPHGSISGYLTPIMACILVLCCASPFLENGFTLDVPDLDTPRGDITDKALAELSDRCYLSAAERETAAYFNDKFQKAGIKGAYAVITADFDEYNDIVITRVSISGARAADKDKLRSLVTADITGCEIVFENSGADDDEQKQIAP